MSCNYSEESLPLGYISTVDITQCLISMLRVMIGDLSDPPMFTDERLAQVIKASAYFTATELSCCSSVNKPTLSLCGDFVEDPLIYPEFVNLMILKAACIVDQGHARQQAIMSGVSAKCGPASLQISSSNNFQVLLKEGPCAAYSALKEDLCWRCPLQSASYCAMVVGSFASGISNCTNVCKDKSNAYFQS